MAMLNTKQAAKVIGNISDDTVRKLCERGDIPARNIGTKTRRQWLIDERMLDRWMLGVRNGTG